MSTPLAPEERAFWRKRTGLPGEVLMAQVVARLLAERDSLERERDEAREQVRSLTVERDAARAAVEQWRAPCLMESVARKSAELRIARAGEALDTVSCALDAARAFLPPVVETRDYAAADRALDEAVGALRAALAEPLANG